MFCNEYNWIAEVQADLSHNPCFSGQCFAMFDFVIGLVNSPCHNPCFSGQCFAMDKKHKILKSNKRHNPCFSGQCFAIQIKVQEHYLKYKSQSLF